MPTKADKLQRFHAENDSPVSGAVPKNSQETHRRKLNADIARTNTFIRQADQAIEQLSKSLGPLAEYSPDIDASSLPAGWTKYTYKQAHFMALYEVYRQLPYSPMKNDSIGIASAVKLTSDAVREQREATQALKTQNDTMVDLLDKLQGIYSEYQEMEAALASRVSKYPQKLAVLERKIRDSGNYEQEIHARKESVAEAVEAAKTAETRMYGHLQRVVMKLHALVDWENASMMDEDTFRRSITSSVSFMHAMVQKLVENGGDSETNWVPVPSDAASARLTEVMARNNVLLAREIDGRVEVRLGDLGH